MAEGSRGHIPNNVETSSDAPVPPQSAIYTMKTPRNNKIQRGGDSRVDIVFMFGISININVFAGGRTKMTCFRKRLTFSPKMRIFLNDSYTNPLGPVNCSLPM